MKTKFSVPMIVIGLLLMLAIGSASYGQDSITQKSQMLDIKLQLLDSKLDLLDTKMKLWEAKPKELDIRLTELNTKVKELDFDPQQMTKKLNEVDSMLRISQSPVQQAQNQPEVEKEEAVAKVPEFYPVYNSAIMLDPVRLLEGTFCLSYERILNTRFSVNLSAMATYSTTQGLSNYYFSNQSFAYMDMSTRQYETYTGEVMSGGGFNVQFRNYLLASHPGRKTAPLGLYAAPQFMYRNMKITGYKREMEETEPGKFEMVDRQVVQHLNIYAGGAVIGMKIPLFKVLALDIFAGGNIRLCEYTGEKGFTKYKDWFNVDFSGVSPVAGIAIGILK
ncbi:MAG: hypothetical protein IPH69_04260 [Bacteroidales bacterium]|nr:hypothetical protein [Bacteroidales bacterium]MBK7625829.1 hypothetical protein [Bacteroidales bacterium]